MMRLVVVLLCVLSAQAFCQPKPVKILFDITSKDTLTHQAVMRHVASMSKAYPESQFEVVVYGGAISMVTKDQSTVTKGIQQLSSNPNVSFKVCEQTMRRYNVDKSKLVNGTETVADAIMEIVTKQSEGWGYIKEAHN